IEELGDLEFYMERIRQIIGVSREETIAANMAKLGKRYSKGTYSNEQAQARADKVEA
ncbi:nucleotide pyrophosphohydrolase, partial [Acinetobacter baumannii]|nr:nucleotide pyrophosphohydrolase [Acinetobacter baumannii]